MVPEPDWFVVNIRSTATMKTMYLKINALKIKINVLHRENGVHKCKLYVIAEKTEQINECLYLDRMFTKERKVGGQILRCANAGRKEMDNM